MSRVGAAPMNRQIRRLAVGLLVCYAVLFVQLNIIQVGKRDELTADFRNDRETLREFNKPRGEIITADGIVVARSVPAAPGDDLKYQREYPLGALFAHITGYTTFAYGSTQLERSQKDVLLGETSTQKLRSITDLFSNDQSGDVHLTMRVDAQQVAADALAGREGSVVVLEPSTGAVIAMVSSPGYDPNAVVVHDAQQAGRVLTELQADPAKPLLANAYQERYMPGSAFKVVTTTIAFQRGITSLDRVFPSERQFVPPQTNDPIENYGGNACGGSMMEVFYRSCNIPFARMALELGPEAMVEGTKAFGIGEKVPIDLPAPVASAFGEVDDFTDRLPLLAIGGFGQGSDVMVPLHMASIAAGIANGGTMMKPHVVAQTVDRDGRLLVRTNPSVWKQPMDAATAATLTSMMIEVVNRGTGTPMQLANGVQAAAKTGTAQLNARGQPQRSHAWIIGFAPAEAPRYAVAVMLKGTTDEISAGTGGRLAGPIAKQVLDHLLAAP